MSLSVGKVALVTAAGLGTGVAGAAIRTGQTLADNRKGSLTNRADCAAKKVANDTNAVARLALPAGAVALTAAVKPGLLSKIGLKGAKYLGKGAKQLGKLFKNPGNKITQGISKALTAIQKNPKKFGKIGLIAAAGLYALKTITKHAENEGRIDQRYNDTGAIENATKHLVLNA